MHGKWTLQIFVIVLFVNEGLFRCLLDEDEFYDENNNFEKNLKEITLMNDETNMDFKEQLKITIEYFERLLNYDKCNESNSSTGGKVSNFDKILMFTSESAVDIYLYNRLHNYTADNLIQNRIDEIKNAMPLECGMQSDRLKELYGSINHVIKSYYTNFPQKSNDIEYNTCYLMSLLEFTRLESVSTAYYSVISARDDKIMKCIALKKGKDTKDYTCYLTSLFKFITFEKDSTAYYKVISTIIDNIIKCIATKSHEENSTDNYFNKPVNNSNSESFIYKLQNKDVKFRNELKSVTKYFKTVLEHYECSKPPSNINSPIEEWNIPMIISLISSFAKENYNYHKSKVIQVEKDFYSSARSSKIIPKECGVQLNENKNLIQNLYQLFNMYYGNFPTKFINDDYSQCFTESVKNIKDINVDEFEFFKNNSAYSRKSLIDIIKMNLVSIIKCVELKEHL